MIKVTYMKSIDLNTEEEVNKEYTFWSNGNYFGLRLIKELQRGQSQGIVSASDLSHPASRDGMGMTTPNDQAVVKVALPGWQTKFPVFIPAVKCRVQVMGLDHYSNQAPLVSNLTRLRFYAVFATGLKSGMRKVHEFMDRYIIQETANMNMPGGLSALNYASLHGNLEAVHQLVVCGGNINNRCKNDNHSTPLHQAVIGGRVDIVKFLLSQGANQLLKDDAGNCPLHYACKLGHITLTRILMDHSGGRRALVILNNTEQKPIDICANNYIKSQVEAVMRKHRIFVPPRISLLDRS